ncbi:MAG: hypothetical protein EP310_03490 [Bacteroidetes bacterium]|nr:MAG: hypothetical protein EP310_03490 [Bacteroidota bacterium]
MKNEKENSPSSVTMLLLLLILVTAGVIILKDKNEIEELKKNQAAMFENLEIRDSLINEMLNTFGKVEENLSFLREERVKIIPVSNSQSKSRQEILVADVVLMNRMLEASSKNFNELKKTTSISYFENELLRNEIEQLNKTIEAYQTEILELKAQLVRHDSEFIKTNDMNDRFQSETDLTSASIETKGQITVGRSLENSIKK